MSSSAPTLVLVHGAWGGGWVWRRVLAPLREAGFEVHTVTLTGDGDRAHLRRPEIDLHTHIADVLGLIEMEELERVVLVGHSYGGMVVTGAAVELQQQHPGEPLNPEEVGREHLRDTVGELLHSSELISDAVAAGRLAIVGANYRLSEGTAVPDITVGVVDADA